MNDGVLKTFQEILKWYARISDLENLRILHSLPTLCRRGIPKFSEHWPSTVYSILSIHDEMMEWCLISCDIWSQSSYIEETKNQLINAIYARVSPTHKLVASASSKHFVKMHSRISLTDRILGRPRCWAHADDPREVQSIGSLLSSSSSPLDASDVEAIIKFLFPITRAR